MLVIFSIFPINDISISKLYNVTLPVFTDFNFVFMKASCNFNSLFLIDLYACCNHMLTMKVVSFDSIFDKQTKKTLQNAQWVTFQSEVGAIPCI